MIYVIIGLPRLGAVVGVALVIGDAGALEVREGLSESRIMRISRKGTARRPGFSVKHIATV